MKYADLSDEAKARAYDEWYKGEPYDDWWDSVYEDATMCGGLIGIDIGTTPRRTMNDKCVDYPDINFSGFCSQGDGASFGGWLRVADMKGAREKLAEHAGKDGNGEELFRIADACEQLFAQITAYWVSHRIDIDADDTSNDYPECTPEMTIHVRNDGHRCFNSKVDDAEVPEDIHTAAQDIANDFAGWIYSSLEAEHDYLTSEAAFKEYIAANEPDYDEDGNPE